MIIIIFIMIIIISRRTAVAVAEVAVNKSSSQQYQYSFKAEQGNRVYYVYKFLRTGRLFEEKMILIFSTTDTYFSQSLPSLTMVKSSYYLRAQRRIEFRQISDQFTENQKTGFTKCSINENNIDSIFHCRCLIVVSHQFDHFYGSFMSFSSFLIKLCRFT